MDPGSREGFAGKEIRRRDRWKVDKGEVPCRGSSDMDANEPGPNAASLTLKIPWVFLMFLGLVFPLVPRRLCEPADTCEISDPCHITNTPFAGGDQSLGVFHELARTGEGVGNGANFQMSCVRDDGRDPGEKIISLT